MSAPLPKPQVGMIIGFRYVWSHEAAAGAQSGCKTRPCVITAVGKNDKGEPLVVVSPVTHSQPDAKGRGIEIPAVVKNRIGLDWGHSWIMCDEANWFRWPGPAVQPLSLRNGQEKLFAGCLTSGVCNAMLERVRFFSKANGMNLVHHPLDPR